MSDPRIDSTVRLTPVAPEVDEARCPICHGTVIRYGSDDEAPCRRCGTEWTVLDGALMLV